MVRGKMNKFFFSISARSEKSKRDTSLRNNPSRVSNKWNYRIIRSFLEGKKKEKEKTTTASVGKMKSCQVALSAKRWLSDEMTVYSSFYFPLAAEY